MIKRLQDENVRLNSKLTDMENKAIPLQIDQNFLQQYGRCNNNEITDSIKNENLESKLVEFWNSIVDDKVIEENDTEDCHRTGKKNLIQREVNLR